MRFKKRSLRKCHLSKLGDCPGKSFWQGPESDWRKLTAPDQQLEASSLEGLANSYNPAVFRQRISYRQSQTMTRIITPVQDFDQQLWVHQNRFHTTLIDGP